MTVNADDGVSADRPNLKDVAASRIREAIFVGRLRPGSRIDQLQLASELRVSKVPVREALIALEGEGLIDNVPRRGSFVARLSQADIIDQYLIFGLVSAEAAERAVSNITDDDIHVLRTLLDEIDVARTAADVIRSENEFHRIINKASDSRRLLAVIKQLSGSIPSTPYLITTGWEAQALKDHREILDAIAAKDASGAWRAAKDHMRNNGEYAVGVLREAGFWD
jgi:DNA-binding GntR family transcriptional regulator